MLHLLGAQIAGGELGEADDETGVMRVWLLGATSVIILVGFYPS